jgi:hypothetical protein
MLTLQRGDLPQMGDGHGKVKLFVPLPAVADPALPRFAHQTPLLTPRFWRLEFLKVAGGENLGGRPGVRAEGPG